MYDFYEEPKHLNIKKVVIVSLILIIFLISILIMIFVKIHNNKNTPDISEKIIEEEKNIVFYSEDKSISVELSKAFNLKPYSSNLGYLLDLRSDNNLDIYISRENMIPNKQLLEIVEADKNVYLKKFESYSNLSEIKELSVNGNIAYTYSFHYLDKNLNNAFYIQVTWLQINDTLYIFDIEFPLDELVFNSNISSSILSSFKTFN